MAVEASDRLTAIISVNWRFTCGCISRPTFKSSASLLEIIGKSRRISEDLRNKKCGPPQVWFIFGNNFQTPEDTLFICTNKYATKKNDGTTQLSYQSERRRIWSPQDERTGARKVLINPRTKDLVKMLDETGERSLYIHSKTILLST